MLLQILSCHATPTRRRSCVLGGLCDVLTRHVLLLMRLFSSGVNVGVCAFDTGNKILMRVLGEKITWKMLHVTVECNAAH